MKNLVFTGILILMILANTALANDKDRGGGNGIGDQMLEGYIVKVESLPGFSSEVDPVLKILNLWFPNMRSPVDAALKRMTWYLIPTPIENLNSKTIGVPTQSTQIATQVFLTEEVFIDRVAFEKLTEKNKGALILHEIFLDITSYLGYESYDYAQLRKLIYTLQNSRSQDDWAIALKDAFSRRAVKHPNDIARMLFNSYEEWAYPQFLDLWAKAVYGSCDRKAYEVYNYETYFKLLKADQDFRSSAVCKNYQSICAGLPEIDRPDQEVKVSEIYWLITCPGN